MKLPEGAGLNGGQKEMFGEVVTVQSQTEPGVHYEVNTVKKTCTCPAFTKQKGKTKRPCKHLKSIPGLIKEKPIPTHPSVSAAMSALIKTVRLRHVEDAVYWLHYLWAMPQERFRVQRRLLIIAAEDNLSVPVMIRMSNWWASQKRDHFQAAVAEVLRVCKTENWWAQEGGFEYMLAWRDAEKYAKEHGNPYKGMKYPALRQVMATAVQEHDVMHSFLAYYAMYEKDCGYDAKDFGRFLYEMAVTVKSLQARATIGVYNANFNLLSRDGNYTGQALFRLVKGRFGRQNAPKVYATEVEALVHQAVARWKEPKPMPTYLLDGIHTSGNDRRFAGTVRYMLGCCLAFQVFGRLSPEDKWGSDIWRAIR